MKIPKSFQCFICNGDIIGYKPFLQIRMKVIEGVYYHVHLECFKANAGEQYTAYFESYIKNPQIKEE